MPRELFQGNEMKCWQYGERNSVFVLLKLTERKEAESISIHKRQRQSECQSLFLLSVLFPRCVWSDHKRIMALIP